MTKKAFLLMVSFVLLSGVVSSSFQANTPNIIVVMTDDLDFNLARRLYNQGHLPNIKATWGNGSIFTESYVTTALCCPSRATLLTGQYAHNHGVFGNVAPNGSVTSLDDTSTVATWLHEGGYQVGHIGRYLNGYGSATGQRYVPPGYDWWAALTGPTSPVAMYDYTINKNGEILSYGNQPEDYQTDVLAGFVSEFISYTEQSDAQPFFLIITPSAPHVESSGPGIPGCSDPWRDTVRPAARHSGLLASWQAPRTPAFNEANVTDKPPTIRGLAPMGTVDISCSDQIYRDRAESMLAVDDLVGEMMVNLAAAQEGAVLIFTSDNGYFHGEHRLTQKIIGYTEGIRVPLMISGVGGRAIITSTVLNNDLAPTIAAIADVAPAHVVDGRSLLPLITDPTIAWRTNFLVEYLGSAANWPALAHFQAVQTSQTYYAEWTDGGIEYYDLGLDPYQQRSLHNEPSYSTRVQAAASALEAIKACAGQTCIQAEGQ